MNYNINCISVNMDIRKNQKVSLFFFLLVLYYSFFFFSFLFFFFFMCKTKGDLKKLKDFIVSDSHLFNQWIGAYSGSELWGVLPDYFY